MPILIQGVEISPVFPQECGNIGTHLSSVLTFGYPQIYPVGAEAEQVWSQENHSMSNILHNNGGKCFA